MGQTIILAVVSVIGTISGVLLGFIGYARLRKRDLYTAGAEKGELSTNVNYIKTRLDDMVLEQRDTNRKLDAHSSELSSHAVAIARVEESAKSAHKRIDLLEGKGGG